MRGKEAETHCAFAGAARQGGPVASREREAPDPLGTACGPRRAPLLGRTQCDTACGDSASLTYPPP